MVAQVLSHLLVGLSYLPHKAQLHNLRLTHPVVQPHNLQKENGHLKTVVLWIWVFPAQDNLVLTLVVCLLSMKAWAEIMLPEELSMMVTEKKVLNQHQHHPLSQVGLS